MKKAGIIVALAHRAAQSVIHPGIKTKEINEIVEKTLLRMAVIRLLKVIWFSSCSLYICKFCYSTWYS